MNNPTLDEVCDEILAQTCHNFERLAAATLGKLIVGHLKRKWGTSVADKQSSGNPPNTGGETLANA